MNRRAVIAGIVVIVLVVSGALLLRSKKSLPEPSKQKNDPNSIEISTDAQRNGGIELARTAERRSNSLSQRLVSYRRMNLASPISFHSRKASLKTYLSSLETVLRRVNRCWYTTALSWVNRLVSIRIWSGAWTRHLHNSRLQRSPWSAPIANCSRGDIATRVGTSSGGIRTSNG